MTTSTALTAWELTVAMATPATFMWKPITITRLRITFTTPAMVR